MDLHWNTCHLPEKNYDVWTLYVIYVVEKMKINLIDILQVLLIFYTFDSFYALPVILAKDLGHTWCLFVSNIH